MTEVWQQFPRWQVTGPVRAAAARWLQGRETRYLYFDTHCDRDTLPFHPARSLRYQSTMSNWLKFSLLLVLAVAATTANDESTSAKLLFSKQILNKYLVEGMDIVIKYSLYNVGGSAALDVQLNDNTFSPQDFEVVGGQLKVALDRIAPGANATHVAVIRPLRFGYFNFTSAEVSYLPTEDAAEPLIGYSSEPGQGAIVPFKEYDRKFSPHMMDWIAFAVMTLPSLVIPFLLWWSSKSKYEAIMKQKKDSKRENKTLTSQSLGILST